MSSDCGDPGAIVRLQQLFDSALPNGGYAHSQGLEGLVQAGEVTDEPTLLGFLCHEYADTLAQVELPLFRLAWEASAAGDWGTVGELDELSRAVRPSREFRQAASATGRQTCLLFGRILETSSAAADRLGQASGHFVHFQAPVVLGVLAEIVGIPLAMALPAFAGQLLNGIILPAVKLLQFGPSQVQRLLYQVSCDVPGWVRDSRQVARDEIGTIAPRWDIASTNHAFAERRLFIS